MEIKILIGVVTIVIFMLWVYLMGFKNWLVFAVTQAEKELGGGTGQLKLRYVYDLAVGKFPIIAKLIPFTFFSKLVDIALIKMREMITNKNIATFINK